MRLTNNITPLLLSGLLATGCALKHSGGGDEDGTTTDTEDDTALDVDVDTGDGSTDGGDGADTLDAPDAADVTVEDPVVEDAGSGWLEGWGRRLVLILDHDDVPDNLVDFPVLVHLGASAGREPDDVTFIFDELTDDTMRKKIAVTTEDGVTRCGVEIEKWGSTAREAWLWVNVPLVVYPVDTLLYLYYDASQPDNTSWVGDTDETPAELVWDAAFMGVWHLGDGSGSRAHDSTLYNNHGALNHSNHWIDGGRIDGTYDFDGADDWVECGDDASLRPGPALTVEAWINAREFGDWTAAVSHQWDNGADESGWWLGSVAADGPLVFWVNTALDGWVTTSHSVPVDQWRHVVGTYDGASVNLYINAIPVASEAAGGAIDYDPMPYGLYIGRYHDSDEDFQMNGIIDEVRVSDQARSAAWVRASFESQIDDFIDFGTVETP